MTCSIFVGCSKESLPIARHIEKNLSAICRVKVWDVRGNVAQGGQYYLDSITRSANEFDFCVFICTPDATVVDRRRRFTAPRDNLTFEMGIFAHAIGKERMFILREAVNGVRLPSDLLGFYYISFTWDHSGGAQHSLNSALKHIADRVHVLGRRDGRLAGKRLFQYKGYYPVTVSRDKTPIFDKRIFFKAVEFLRHKKRDLLAATDLSYLWEANRVHLDIQMTPEEECTYDDFVEFYDIPQFMKTYNADYDKIFTNYIRIVTVIGEMLKGCYFEILLHDLRNPLRSIKVIQNSENISRRRRNGPSTSFVVEYLLHQGKGLIDFETSELVSYLKQFELGKSIKASTIPIFDEQYGLAGIICVNIDIDQVSKVKHASLTASEFFAAYTRHTGHTPKFEKRPLIQLDSSFKATSINNSVN
jgi:predicted transcriptional regulator YheO